MMKLGVEEELFQRFLQDILEDFPRKHPLGFFSFSVEPEEIEFTRAYSLGMIRKEDLVVGKYYEGKCRNASVARWNGSEFEYNRWKWKSRYKDKVSYPSDEDYFDVFIPWAVAAPSDAEVIDKEIYGDITSNN